MSDDIVRTRPDSTTTSRVVDRRPISTAPADARVYRTGDTVHTHEVAPAFVLGRPHLHWSAVIGGLLTALTAMFLLSLLGGAIGLTQFNAATAAAQGGVPGEAGRNSAIWAGISGILSFLLGGYVAARLAHLLDRQWGAWHGAGVHAGAANRSVARWAGARSHARNRRQCDQRPERRRRPGSRSGPECRGSGASQPDSRRRQCRVAAQHALGRSGRVTAWTWLERVRRLVGCAPPVEVDRRSPSVALTLQPCKRTSS
jgi:hypothetical protein